MWILMGPEVGPESPDWALGLALRRAPTGPNSWLQRWALINNEKKCPAKETPGRSLKITRRILTFRDESYKRACCLKVLLLLDGSFVARGLLAARWPTCF